MAKQEELIMSKWIPVSSGKFPKEEERVQVTYLSCYDNKPLCDAFAFRKNGSWIWDTCEDVVVEIVAWKKIGKPYNPFHDHIGEVTRMVMDIKFDRPINPDRHYISPGGYTIKCKDKSYSFDFMDYEGNVDKDDPTILHAEVSHLDEDYSNDLSKFNSEKIEETEESYIYTGEGEDPEINPVEVLSLTLEQNLTVTNIDKKLLKSIIF